MSARHWMIGCLIGLAGLGSAMAADLDTGAIASSTHGAVDGSTRDAGGGNGDALGLNHDNSALHHDGGTDDNDTRGNVGGTAGGSEHGSRIPAPVQARPATLGWQSLLPGSIQ